jgi:TetR/AcrR family transcriptional repressor of nem operon
MIKGGRPREFKDLSVIDAAIDVFWSKGYEACSTKDLCEKTGIGRGSLYNAFGSKHELYEQALQRYHEIGIHAQIEILEQPGPIKERLRELLEWAVDADFSNPERSGCMAINAAMERAGVDPAVDQMFNEHIELLQIALCRTLEKAQSTGEISSERPILEMASLFLSSYYGLRVLNKGTQNRDMAALIVNGTLAAIFS